MQTLLSNECKTMLAGESKYFTSKSFSDQTGWETLTKPHYPLCGFVDFGKITPMALFTFDI
jgi:hypothetical protein